MPALLFALGILPPRQNPRDLSATKVYRRQIRRPFARVHLLRKYLALSSSVPLRACRCSRQIVHQSEVVVALVCNAAVLLSQDTPRTVLSAHIVHALCPSAPSMATPNSDCLSKLFHDLHPRFLAGLAFVGAGALLRLWSLGELFTFEVVVRPDRRLITSGPHADTRHIRASRCSSVGSSCSWGMGRLSGEGSRARGSLILRMCSYHLCAGTGSCREIWKCVGRVRGGGAVSSRPVRLVIREDSVIWCFYIRPDCAPTAVSISQCMYIILAFYTFCLPTSRHGS